jgi:hypothetical protein
MPVKFSNEAQVVEMRFRLARETPDDVRRPFSQLTEPRFTALQVSTQLLVVSDRSLQQVARAV